ncbi:dTDP-4-dehydrorhamnose 3,5-epimerase [Anseongella ginsenosidimutans]|uniref:dTDP-4-dehydrorhamnose 3,5-epimerase n=1 Tax=Anseongella ginsenosidimutans TaxID=496056 RepID=A0A4R3KW94_9SPHI|nr:dTDP-4-dehydrorhamnose 3,5-epimerase [Anseongella ginsenosidimutans]QEC51283.1 dTDP-4-dehydrorhamnose 3,5-epimerase [Anseongella ginsenosidimutans]TCS90027.1 dTDP-4-dehydrorhamnose 3,5-epimerase [Anseongella ginsenosidimutans]
MQITPTPLEGVLIFEPRVFHDSRGYFLESFNKKVLKENNLAFDFVQDNQSLSQQNTLRGLHFQAPPYAQAKLVRVARGAVLDVVVDIRKTSPTYGKHFSIVLSDENNLQLLIPEGFAHGFLVIENNTVFVYKCSQYYHKESEGGIFWADKHLAIDWGTDNPIVSEKDQLLPQFDSFESPF